MIPEGELLHPPQDEHLDLGNLLQVDERVVVIAVPRRVYRRPAISDHGTGTALMTSSMTISTLTPWLAACGPSQTRCGST